MNVVSAVSTLFVVSVVPMISLLCTMSTLLSIYYSICSIYYLQYPQYLQHVPWLLCLHYLQHFGVSTLCTVSPAYTIFTTPAISTVSYSICIVYRAYVPCIFMNRCCQCTPNHSSCRSQNCRAQVAGLMCAGLGWAGQDRAKQGGLDCWAAHGRAGRGSTAQGRRALQKVWDSTFDPFVFRTTPCSLVAIMVCTKGSATVGLVLRRFSSACLPPMRCFAVGSARFYRRFCVVFSLVLHCFAFGIALFCRRFCVVSPSVLRCFAEGCK